MMQEDWQLDWLDKLVIKWLEAILSADNSWHYYFLGFLGVFLLPWLLRETISSKRRDGRIKVESLQDF